METTAETHRQTLNSAPGNSAEGGGKIVAARGVKGLQFGKQMSLMEANMQRSSKGGLENYRHILLS